MSAIVVTGAAGQLGRAFRRQLAERNDVNYIDVAELNLTDVDAVRTAFRQWRPRLVIHCAAFTDVDTAEDKVELAHAVNAVSPRIIAECQAEHGGAIVHFSTDYVFDGSKTAPYEETDPTAPVSVYGRTKRDGEVGVAGSGATHLILRTSWVYSWECANFFLTMLRLFQSRPELRVVADQFGAPNYVEDMVSALVTALDLRPGTDPAARLANRSGLYHLSATGATSWAGYASRILELARAAPELASRLQCQRMIPIPAAEYPTKASRPANSRLSTDKARRELGIALPDWTDALKRCMQQYQRHLSGQ